MSSTSNSTEYARLAALTANPEVRATLEALAKKEAARAAPPAQLPSQPPPAAAAAAAAPSSSSSSSSSSVSSSSSSSSSKITKNITAYAWDGEGEKKVKIYISLPGVESIPAENVTAEILPKSVGLLVRGLKGADHRLGPLNLAAEIDPDGSRIKVSSGRVSIFLKKKEAGKKWAHLTSSDKKKDEQEKAKAAEKSSKMDSSDDPQASIMKLMQDMYNDGDDEMKKTIAKAWTESRDGKKPRLDDEL